MAAHSKIMIYTEAPGPPDVEADYRRQLEEMRQQWAEAKEDAENAWRLNTSSETEMRRVKTRIWGISCRPHWQKATRRG